MTSLGSSVSQMTGKSKQLKRNDAYNMYSCSGVRTEYVSCTQNFSVAAAPPMVHRTFHDTSKRATAAK